MKFAQVKYWLTFFLKTWRSPNTYRKLFRDISNCYLTAKSPGRATVKGFVTTCITNLQYMIVTLDGNALFYIDREALTVRTQGAGEDMPIYDKRVAPLKTVFDEMIKHGIPFKMSNTNVTDMGI